MPEFFLELFSEEIPARMQALGARSLRFECEKALESIKFRDVRIFLGPRRIGLAGTVNAYTDVETNELRGPRQGAPEAAVDGFLKKNNASRSDLIVEGGYYVIRRVVAPVSAINVILQEIGQTPALKLLAWPKAMRWSQGGDFSWVRPLRRIVCLLDGEVVPITLGPITASNETEGHRIHGPGPIAVFSAAIWEEKLREHYVIADQDERRRKIAEGIAEKAGALGLSVAPDDGLLDEVTGLVEWPVPLIGKIDEQFMDLPPEVRELSMKVNQKYFALRDAQGNPAPYFAFVSNLAAEDEGAAIIAGNERVLRARLSDARYFWDTDLKTPLNELLPKLEKITFHAKIGTQRKRADEIASLAKEFATWLGASPSEAKQAEWAGLLCKADLVSGMVGEFPELQGVIGGYYAEQNPNGWEGSIVGPAIKSHYQPKGPSDNVPVGVVPIAVALADKLYTLIEFFRIGERPTGSGDPFALRRAALGVIRIILENRIKNFTLSGPAYESPGLLEFILDRLRVKLRGEGKRFDVLDAAYAGSKHGDILDLMKRVNALTEMLETDDGKNLHAAYKRASNILRIEDPENKLFRSIPTLDSLTEFAEVNLSNAIGVVIGTLLDRAILQNELYAEAMSLLASLRPAIDAFFEKVTVNVSEPEVRLNRLRLLARFRDTVNLVADFSKIEG